MITFISHVIIFQENERLREALPFLYVNQNGLQNVKNKFLLEHISALDEVKVRKVLSQFGFPIKPSCESITMAIWLSQHLLSAYQITHTKNVDNVYTPLHCVNCGVVSQQIPNPLNLNCFKTYFMETLLGSSMPLNLRKALLVTALTSGSHSLTALGGFHNGKE